MKGDGTVYKRGNVWWIKFHRDGRPVYMSCAGLTEAQARTKLKKELRKTDDEFVEPKLKRVTIAELVADLLSDYEAKKLWRHREETERRWRLHLAPAFSETRAHQFGTTEQREYRKARAEAGAADATINRELQILRHAFKQAAEHEPPKVKRVPKFLITKEENAREGFVTVPQLAALKDAASKEGLAYRVLVELAHWLGWRKGELLQLRVSHVHLHDGGPQGCIRLEAAETKNKKPREIALSPSLRLFLEPMVLQRKPEERLFPFRTLDFRTWDRIRKAAGFPDLMFHDLRRSSARSKRSAGVSESVIMEMQGWKTDAMFRRYGIVASEDKITALKMQEEFERRQLNAAQKPN